MITRKEQKLLLFFSFLLLTIFLAGPVYGYVMSSQSYRIQRDTIGIGGGLSTSTSYIIEDTLGDTASGFSSSTSYLLQAGYQQSDQVSISITNPGDLSLGPNIDGLTGGTAAGSLGFNVSTNDNAGYSLFVKTESNPAMRCLNGGCNVGVDGFSDYAPVSVSTPDFIWSIPSSASAFGFSPGGSNIISKYKNDGLACNTGNDETPERCWNGLTTDNEQVAGSSSANLPAGVTTTLRFQAEIGSAYSQPNGNYQATVVVTAIAN